MVWETYYHTTLKPSHLKTESCQPEGVTNKLEVDEKIGVPFWHLCTGDYSILGSMLGGWALISYELRPRFPLDS